MNRWVGQIERDIIEHGVLVDGQVILVAVSGGIDSVVLLDVLQRLAPRHRWKLVVGHCHHQLRGRPSDADERFVRRLAAQLELPIKSVRVDVRGAAKRQNISIEMAARRCRHDFLARTAVECGATAVALGHHADDQVELFLWRLLRGAGSEGLRGMDWMGPSPANSRIALVRPLLGRTRDEIMTHAQAWELSFRHDDSNDSIDILRNRIRHDLIPRLRRDYQPGLSGVILRQAEILGRESDFLEEESRRWLETRGPDFESLPVALQRRILVEQLVRLGLSPEFEKVEALRRSAGIPVRQSEAIGVQRDANGTITVVASRPTCATAAGPTKDNRTVELDFTKAGSAVLGDYRVQWNVRLRSRGRAGPRPIGIRQRAGREWFDADRVGSRGRLRHWESGDRFQPLGLGAAARLQNLFINAGVPREERRTRPVAVTEGGDIWWVAGLRIGEGFQIRPQTRRLLEWKWSKCTMK